MSIVSSPTECREKLISFPEKELNSSDKVSGQYDMRMIQMRPLFKGLPQLEKICKNRSNGFVDSGCKEYIFEVEDDGENGDEEIKLEINDLHEKVIDLKYIINFCGYNLTQLNVEDYPFSKIMPLINNNCPNIETLSLAFKEVQSRDFENVFCNMSHLNTLSIEWRNNNNYLPETLIKSLEQVGRTLEYFYLECYTKRRFFNLSHSLASVFLKFVVLKRFHINGFQLNQPLIESIGRMQNLVNLSFSRCWHKTYQMHISGSNNADIDMHPITNLKNLVSLVMDFDYGVTDKFLINLSDNAKNLNYLSGQVTTKTRITDAGKDALSNLEKLKVVRFCHPYRSHCYYE